ncbi:unnamed protein product [Heligmosomoides polygyrus]|uniref:Uncharacterized protein n=1 Tax=Heligmosomoides polygyrus TaxID=6339 RepID=A0A3P8BSN1_HELPZ|nr:unnamed protein product [Heligmosomoides polygyrus]
MQLRRDLGPLVARPRGASPGGGWGMEREPNVTVYCPETQWKTSRTALLYKKGDVHNISNYRPTCLLSVAYKLFTRVQ